MLPLGDGHAKQASLGKEKTVTRSLLMSLTATVLMFGFGAVVLRRYLAGRQLYNLFWGLGLVMFGIATFAEGYLATSWNDPLFRTWYACGAILNAAWLGHGTLLLLFRRSWVRYLTVILVVLSLFGLIVVFTLQLNSSAYTAGTVISDQYKLILPKGALVRMLTPIFNIYGSLFLIGGAVISAFRFWRKQAPAQRVVGNLLIAAGALAAALAGTLTRLLFGGFMPVSELIAAVLMFAGFVVSSAVPERASAIGKPA
jgi:hypothetical protein